MAKPAMNVKPWLCLLLVAALLPLAPAEAARKRRSSSGGSSSSGVTPTPTPANLPPELKLPVPQIPPEMTELPLAADGAISMDALSGRVLYEKDADTPRFPASTTKILTALLVIEAGDLDHPMVVTEEDAKVGESSLNIVPGETFTRRQALYGLMLKSANDVAHALACDNAGSEEAFAEKMTRRARELGATRSSFKNPHGLHHPEHYCSPRDLALISRAALQQPLFRQIVSTTFHPWLSQLAGPMQLRNHNRLLWMYPGCTGLKTGYTRPAGQVLSSSAQRGLHEVISIVMHTNKPGIWEDSKLLLTWGLNKLEAPPVEAAVTAAPAPREGAAPDSPPP